MAENIIKIKAVDIEEYYDEVTTLMRPLQTNEQNLMPRRAAWDDIEASYMRHMIARQKEN